MVFLVYLVFQILTWAIVAQVVISWITYSGAARISPYHPAVRLLNNLVEPILAPFRKLINPRAMGGLDLSPFFAILVLNIIEQLLISVLR